jgi:hypothetical protein
MIEFVLANGANIVAATIAVLGAAYAVALVIPGEQPDKAFKSLLDFTVKFSKK